MKNSTAYMVTILPGMKDPYGQAIETQTTVHFKTAAAHPWAHMLMQYGASLYRTGGPQEFYFQYINVPTVTFRLYKLSEAGLVAILDRYYPQEEDVPSTDPVWTYVEKSTAGLDQMVFKKLRLGAGNNTPLAAGAYLLTMESMTVPSSGRYVELQLVVVASASITLKSSPGDALVWLTDLTSGQPIPGVPVSVYTLTYSEGGAVKKDVLTGATGPDGLVHLTNQNINTAAYAISNDDQHFALSVTNWGSGVSPYQFGISEGYYAAPMPQRAYVYTDRPIYRPGQPVFFKGIVRMDDDLAYSLPEKGQVRVDIESFKGTVSRETMDLSATGAFDGKLQLDADAALGSYSIKVFSLPDDQPIGQVSFNVAEYRRPEYLVTVTADPLNLLSGEQIHSHRAGRLFLRRGSRRGSGELDPAGAALHLHPARDPLELQFR